MVKENQFMYDYFRNRSRSCGVVGSEQDKYILFLGGLVNG